MLLQTACQLSYIVNNDDDRSTDVAQHLPRETDDFQQPVDFQTNENTTLETDHTRSSPVPVVPDDSQSLTDAELQQSIDSMVTYR